MDIPKWRTNQSAPFRFEAKSAEMKDQSEHPIRVLSYSADMTCLNDKNSNIIELFYEKSLSQIRSWTTI